MAIIWPPEDSETYWQGGSLTTKGAAKALGVTPQTIRNYVKDKRFPNPKKKSEGGRHYYLFSKDLVVKYNDKIKEIRGG